MGFCYLMKSLFIALTYYTFSWCRYLDCITYIQILFTLIHPLNLISFALTILFHFTSSQTWLLCDVSLHHILISLLLYTDFFSCLLCSCYFSFAKLAWLPEVKGFPIFIEKMIPFSVGAATFVCIISGHPPLTCSGCFHLLLNARKNLKSSKQKSEY